MAFSFFGKKPVPTKPLSSSRPRVAPKTSAAIPVVGADGALDVLTEGKGMRLEVTTSGLDPWVEQAAILYAADHQAEARAALEAGIERNEVPEEGWRMLFELYQLSHDAPRFDALALKYAARFEKSPPAWHKNDSAPPAAAAATGRAVLPLSGRLDARSAEVLKQLRRMAAGSAVLRVDLAKLRDADEAGCALLLSVLEEMQTAKRQCLLSGLGPLSAVLAGKIRQGQRDNEAVWRLLLELLQRQGLQARFEETALQFALTFEVSPPSWRAPPLARAAAATAAKAVAAQPAGLQLQGRIVCAGPDSFAFLLAAAGERLEVDAGSLQRIDFVSAGILLNTVLALHRAGKRVRIHHLSHLVAALFASLGIGRIAVLETKNN